MSMLTASASTITPGANGKMTTTAPFTASNGQSGPEGSADEQAEHAQHLDFEPETSRRAEEAADRAETDRTTSPKRTHIRFGTLDSMVRPLNSVRSDVISNGIHSTLREVHLADPAADQFLDGDSHPSADTSASALKGKATSTAAQPREDSVQRDASDAAELTPPVSAFGKQPSPTSLSCPKCGITTSDADAMVMHLRGKKHHKRMVGPQADSSANGDEGSSSRPQQAPADAHCDVCHIDATSQAQLHKHVQGKRHTRALEHEACQPGGEVCFEAEPSSEDAEAKLEKAGSSPEALGLELVEGGVLRCTTCGIDLESKQLASSHVRGQRHLPADAGDKVPIEMHHMVSQDLTEDTPTVSGDVSLGSSASASPAAARATVTFGSVELSEIMDNTRVPPASPFPAMQDDSAASTAGGSISLAATHFCPVCGIIATSAANLQDHLRGRRHARRLQYLKHMPEQERSKHIERIASGDLLFRQHGMSTAGSMDSTTMAARLGSLTLPSSMDIALYLEQVQLVDMPEPTPRKSRLSDLADLERGPKEVHHCPVCSITTTSAAHLEAHMAGRKHRRRAEVAEGRVLRRSPHVCRLCDISTTSADHMALHVAGRAHQRRLRAEAAGGPGGAVGDASADASSMGSRTASGADGIDPNIANWNQRGASGNADTTQSSHAGPAAPLSASQNRWRPGVSGPAGNSHAPQGMWNQYEQPCQMMGPMAMPGYVGFYPPPPFFPSAGVMAPPAFGLVGPNWWPAAPHPPPQNQRHQGPPTPPQRHDVPPPNHNGYHNVSMNRAGSSPHIPVVRQRSTNLSLGPQENSGPMRGNMGAQGPLPGGPEDGSGADAYNCNTCQVQVNGIDKLRNHMRSRQHVRRVASAQDLDQ
ncbi:hypothetical protein WJX73_008406 [Symbiochloris irregularis]|uniref:C2H2-type domain-containing protein n=1 Tax=Symbiochloris irregularis TaxID=706552 RepID=A0AAW1NR84_9CHLO